MLSKHVWTTFSADQVDLNWTSPDLLFEFLDIIMFYVSIGCRILRLDAVAFLWKEIGTNCLHLPKTHEFLEDVNNLCLFPSIKMQLHPVVKSDIR